MTSIQNFNTLPFIQALKGFFKELHIPIDYIADEPTSAEDILEDFYNPSTHQLIDEVYALGMVNNEIFNEVSTFNNLKQIREIKEDYEGLLIFGITLKSRRDGLLPTRSQLTDITRAFNRAFPHTPVTVIFKYDNFISFANSERTKYNQQWRDGEKLGKVTLLRDIDFTDVHSGHHRILAALAISKTGKIAVNSFDELYTYWQGVLNVSILNKAFYNELQNWYFWAIKEVNFPNPPNRLDFNSDNDFDEALKEHKGKNVIRLLTRILFIWFIKEKGLIPEEIFNEKIISNDILKEFEPQKPQGLFATGKQSSKYYRAILQNLFFATLNQSCGKREFRGEGKHQNITQLMRYKNYFKDADYFVNLMEKTVPFMNGGLFECLDKPHPTAKGKQGGDRIIYVDGFSDRTDNELVVPDFLFFDADEDVDLSSDLGNAKFKNSKTRGLIAILKSYKFTITENTPIDEDVALDPELLGKVFENLLASYNPETKTTARKQTGSFYTPREIVDYMVDESLIAYLKNHLNKEGFVQNEAFLKLDEKLHDLVSYSNFNPFADDETTQKKIIKALDNCKILDPACGSGAYPMGILQKMVHILHKIDPNNNEWKNRQLKRVDNAIAELEQLDDTTFRENTIRDLEAQKDDIEESFSNNELDYGRKLYLIENCIFGVDIQAIATQISKLRFFISLVVDQKVDAQKENFGIRPLPNLETKFVAANTLIGIDKPKKQGDFFGSLFDRTEVQKLEKDLKKIRQRLFSAKTPSLKRSLREQDKALRESMGDLLVQDYGNATARQLANWDPYDQNTSSDFFDKEWMFDISDGFDIVIGNPPYVQLQKMKDQSNLFKNQKFESFESTGDLYCLFYEKGIQLLKPEGIETYITSSQWLKAGYGKSLRKLFLKHNPLTLLELGPGVFDSATVDSNILIIQKKTFNNSLQGAVIEDIKNISNTQKINLPTINENSWAIIEPIKQQLNQKIIAKSKALKDWKVDIYRGVLTGYNEAFLIDETKRQELINQDPKSDEIIKPILRGRDINRYTTTWDKSYLINIHNGIKSKKIDRIKIENYSNVKIHIDSFGENVIKRTDQGDTHYNLRNCAYLDEFFKEKLIWKRIGSQLRFSYSDKPVFCLDSTCIATGEKIKYLTALLNSKLCCYQLFENAPKTGMGDLIISVQALEPLLVYYPNNVEEKPFIDLVDKILADKHLGKDTSALEAEIDSLVYQLYGLTEAEIAVVEGR